MAFTLEPVAPIDGSALLPLTIVKDHLRVSSDDEDDLITTFRDAALGWVERHVGRALTPRAWRWSGDCFGDRIVVPIEPVVSIQALAYRDLAGGVVALPEAAWFLSGGEIAPIAGTRFPTTLGGRDAILVTFTAGYEPDQVPAPLKTAALLMAGHLYRNREAVIVGTIATEAPLSVQVLCAPWRTPVIG